MDMHYTLGQGRRRWGRTVSVRFLQDGLMSTAVCGATLYANAAQLWSTLKKTSGVTLLQGGMVRVCPVPRGSDCHILRIPPLPRSPQLTAARVYRASRNADEMSSNTTYVL